MGEAATTANPAAPGADAPASAAWRLLAVVPLAALIGFVSLLPAITAGETLSVGWAWVPGLDVRLSFYVDGLSLLFALLISGIGFFIFLYAGSYLGRHPRFGRFSIYLLAFMGSMLGLVLADNIITLFVFWELTTLTSYLLIGFDHTQAKARRNALQALLVTGIGGLALLAGLILMAIVGGSFELSQLIAQGDAIREHALHLPILILVLAGAFTKSAQFPFHFWLPNAMAAPTPVSAYLHSATMVKAGVYLLARMHPALGDSDWWTWTLLIAGAVTAVWASLLAIRQSDLKLMLAYTTLMALGTLVMFLGAENYYAIAAAVTFILVHSFYKAALFMVVGIIDHEAGTREIDRLGGLRGALPITFAAALAAAFSMAGFPPFLGFIGKELKYEGALAISEAPIFMTTAAVTANALMVAVALVVVIRPFLGTRPDLPKVPHEAPVAMWLGPVVLAACGIIFGVAPGAIGNALVDPTVEAILYSPQNIELKLWHGINLPLALSVVTVTLGAFFFVMRRRLIRWTGAWLDFVRITGDAAYDRAVAAMMAFAAWQTDLLQGGRQRIYLATTLITFIVLVGGTLIAFGGVAMPAAWPSAPLPVWGIAALIVAGALATTQMRSRIGALAAVGSAGTGVALLFLAFGAPDVAMTQFMIETLSVVIAALILPRLPAMAGRGHPGRHGRLRDAAIAVACGTVVTLLVIAVTAGPFDRSLTGFFEIASVPDAFGRNIVNVILVDFRAIDTFGEIAVVAIAGLASVALIRQTMTSRRDR